MIKFSKLRINNFKDRKKQNLKFGFDITDWRRSPYSCFKARIYIELSSIFAFLFQFTSITANQISLIYCFLGLVAGILLASGVDFLMITGLVVFFLKGSMDWTDGLVARIKNQTSSVGHMLDTWGSHIGEMSLITAIGIFCFNFSNNLVYLFLLIIILFLNVIDFKLFSFHQSFYELVNKKIQLNLRNIKKIKKKELSFSYQFLKNFMDGRARTVDTICFLLFFEIIYKVNYFSPIIFSLYFLKSAIFFFGIIYLYYLKKKLENLIK